MAQMVTDIPSELGLGPVRLRFEKTEPGDPLLGLAPSCRFRIFDEHGTEVGHINFRVGATRHITMTAGHIGYAILPEHRGFSYAYHACLALAPFIRLHYDRVILTSNPENAPSIRIIEKLGASFINEVKVPVDDPAFVKGARRKRRYEWVLSSEGSLLRG
jgi:predicted acetyltransferase